MNSLAHIILVYNEAKEIWFAAQDRGWAWESTGAANTP